MISHKHILTLAAFLIYTGISTPVLYAQTPASTPASSRSLTDALQHALSTDKRLAPLSKTPTKPGPILSIEILDSQLSAVVEIEVTHNKKNLRYPLKFTRATPTADWQLAWAPTQDYTQALLNITSSTALPTTPSEPTIRWTHQTRIVAFPIIATRQQIITPFGALAPTNLSDQSAPLTPPDELVRHATRWITDILEDAPAPAAIDLVLDARLSWKAITRLVMATSAVGFFRVHIVTTNTDDSITAIPVNAPIFDTQKLPDHIHMLVVGIYPLSPQQADKKLGFRIAYNNQILQLPQSCQPEMSFCITDPADFSLRLQQLTKTFDQTRQTTHIMFAAPKNASLQTALDYMQTTAHTLQIPTEKTFIGFIQ